MFEFIIFFMLAFVIFRHITFIIFVWLIIPEIIPIGIICIGMAIGPSDLAMIFLIVGFILFLLFPLLWWGWLDNI